MDDSIDLTHIPDQYEISIFIAEHSFTGARAGIAIPHKQGFRRDYLEYLANQMLQPGEIIVNRHRLTHELQTGLRVCIIMDEEEESEQPCQEESQPRFSETRKSLRGTLTKILFRILRI